MMEQMTGLDAQLPSGSCRKLQRREGRGNPLRQQSPPNLFGRDLIMEDSFSMGGADGGKVQAVNVSNGEWPLKLAHPPLTCWYAAEFLNSTVKRLGGWGPL